MDNIIHIVLSREGLQVPDIHEVLSSFKPEWVVSRSLETPAGHIRSLRPHLPSGSMTFHDLLWTSMTLHEVLPSTPTKRKDRSFRALSTTSTCFCLCGETRSYEVWAPLHNSKLYSPPFFQTKQLLTDDRQRKLILCYLSTVTCQRYFANALQRRRPNSAVEI